MVSNIRSGPSSQHTERIETIYRASVQQRRRLRQHAMTLQKQLDQLAATGTTSDGQAVPLIGRLCAVEKARNVARTMMLVRMHWVLTPVQRHQLADVSIRSPGFGRPISGSGTRVPSSPDNATAASCHGLV